MVLEVSKGPITTLKLNRPSKRNALNLELIEKLISTFSELRNDPTVRVVMITGNGSSFCAGGDITEMTHRYGKALVTKNRLDEGINNIVLQIRKIKRPVLAVVNGACYGAGLVLATACDVLYASKSAKFGFSHGNMGLIPEGAYFLSRSIGLHKTKELVFSRETINATTAAKLNLVTRVLPDDELEEYSMKVLKQWSQGPIETMGLAKEVLNHGFETPLRQHLEYEALAQGAAFTGEEHKEGVSAFLEKRDADFVNPKSSEESE